MRRSVFKTGHPSEYLIPLLVLAFLVVYTWGIYLQAPYSGFYFNPTDGTIIQVIVPGKPGAALFSGDVLEQVGPVSWAAYYHNGNQAFFQGVRAGDVVPVRVRRGAADVTVPWVFPGFNQVEFSDRVFNLPWLAYIFWIFGTATQLIMRPKDLRWRYLVLANYLTAAWLIAGDLSAWHIWGSSLLLHALSWLVAPVYLALHWVFPKSLGRVPRWASTLFFVTGGLLAALELFELLPRPTYLIGFVLAIGGSILLLAIHFFRQPAQRSEVSRLALAFALALIPAIVQAVTGLLGSIPVIGPLAFVALPVMPGAYLYAIYRTRLGGLELRANRIISAYFFLVLLTVLLPLLVGPFLPAQLTSEAALLLVLVAGVLTALAAILAFPTFQGWVERRLLGIRLVHETLQETYAARISTSLSRASLEQLLRDEVLPSLFVRQFVFNELRAGRAETLLCLGVDPAEVPAGREMERLLPGPGRYRPVEKDQPFGWVRLVLPLKVGDELMGYWLMGRRDPDDTYSQAEIPILQSLADQTAIALGNLQHATRLRQMYQSDIERNERERLRLAHELHDDVLNEMAALMLGPRGRGVPEDFKTAYDALSARLREIASDLRPPTLSDGLKPAFAELADTLMQRTGDSVDILVEIEPGEGRYPAEIEQNLFRIVQQGLENALRHGKARNIRLTGRMDPAGVELTLEDDGAGFETGPRPDLGSLLETRHFGLAGMYERGALIGASVEISSVVGRGTRVGLAWKQTGPG